VQRIFNSDQIQENRLIHGNSVNSAWHIVKFGSSLRQITVPRYIVSWTIMDFADKNSQLCVNVTLCASAQMTDNAAKQSTAAIVTN